jgi:hypothetical protein
VKALLLAALLAQADAPTLELPPQGRTIEVAAGDMVPFDGVCLDGDQSLRSAKRVAACEAGLKVAESKTLISTPVLVAGIVGIVVVAFAAGAATAYAVKR